MESSSVHENRIVHFLNKGDRTVKIGFFPFPCSLHMGTWTFAVGRATRFDVAGDGKKY